MIGHSLIGPENPRMLQQLLAAGQDNRPVVEYQVINGAPLRYNWEHADKAQGINARERLAKGPVDAVIVSRPFCSPIICAGVTPKALSRISTRSPLNQIPM